MNVYPSGTLVRSTASFTNVSKQATDPDTVTVKYQLGAGSSVITGSSVRDATGTYHLDIDTTGWAGPGNQTVTVQWGGTGAAQVTGSGQFEVEPLPLG